MHTNNVFELVSVDPVRRFTMDSDASDLGITHISGEISILETNIPLHC